MKKFEIPELEIILFEGDLAADDNIGNSDGWGGDIGGGNDSQVPGF